MDTSALRTVLRELATLLDRRAERMTASGLASADEPVTVRVERLRRHVREYLIPRVANIDAPLVAVLIGSTGAGKSSLINALAGRRVSPSGVLRPTTRRPVVVATDADARKLADRDLLPALGRTGQLDVVAAGEAGREGILLVDAPDIDSVEASNRQLAARLLESADLCVVVTTAARYADQMPWLVLERARERGAPLIAVLNRLPEDEEDAAAVIADYWRMLERAGLGQAGTEGDLLVVPVKEGALDAARDALAAGAVRPVARALDRLAASKRRRQELARRSLSNALDGLPPAIEAIARDVEREVATGDRLADAATAAYTVQREALLDKVRHGGFLRSEVLRQWQEFVGTSQVSRLLTTGIGRITSAVGSFFSARPPTSTEHVQEAAFDDLVALATGHAAEAARQAASDWSDDPLGSRLLAAHRRLWSADDRFPERLRGRLEGWTGEIGDRIRREGEGRRGFARAASIGLNVVGTGMILAVFSHTGGLTGAELGIAAVTAAVNQRLLEAIFGEAAVRDMVVGARRRLAELLEEALTEDRARFDVALEIALPQRVLPAELRDMSARVAAAAQ